MTIKEDKYMYFIELSGLLVYLYLMDNVRAMPCDMSCLKGYADHLDSSPAKDNVIMQYMYLSFAVVRSMLCSEANKTNYHMCCSNSFLLHNRVIMTTPFASAI